MYATAPSAAAPPSASLMRPPGPKFWLVHPPGSAAESNSSPMAGVSCSSPSSPSSVWPGRVLLCVPAANSAVRESTSAPGGVWKLAGSAAGDVAELPEDLQVREFPLPMLS